MSVTVHLPQGNANDTSAVLVEWLLPAGAAVRTSQPIAVFETSKVAYEIEAPAGGYLFPYCRPGDRVAIGTVIAIVAETSDAPITTKPRAEHSEGNLRVITEKARALMTALGIEEADLPSDLTLIKGTDIERIAAAQHAPSTAAEESADQDAVFTDPDYQMLHALLGKLRMRMRQKFNRHVPTGTLLHDRWQLAEAFGFGNGSSVYDESLILGTVEVGDHCWIGPFTVLDGSGGLLRIGDWTSIGVGAHLYTHHTIDQALTGGIAKPVHAATTIGRCCFIAPLVIVAPGSEIGDHSFLAAHSYVEGSFPPYSYLAGVPAQRIGRVEIHNGRAFRYIEALKGVTA